MVSISRAASCLAALCLIATGPAAVASPLDSVVGVHATVPKSARTAESLGTERAGSGVVIAEDGLTLTIGYLVMESERTELSLPDGREVPAELVAYDFITGFGLLRPLMPIDIPPVALGRSGELAVRSEVLVAGHGGAGAAHPAYVVDRREFAGYWEYLLPDAIFTAPPYREFGGAALFGRDGALLGIGSLAVGDAAGDGQPVAGNMFVPIDALKPILDDLVAKGRAAGPDRPWLGIYLSETRGHLFVERVASYGPAARDGLEKDDIVVAVGAQPVTGLAELYRAIWALGEAGVEVPLTVLRGGRLLEIAVASASRYDHLRLKPTY